MTQNGKWYKMTFTLSHLSENVTQLTEYKSDVNSLCEHFNTFVVYI